MNEVILSNIKEEEQIHIIWPQGSSSKVSHETFPPVVSRDCPSPPSAWPLQTSAALYLPSTASLAPIPGRFEGVPSHHLPSAILLHIH